MKDFEYSDLKELAGHSENPCISVCQPTHIFGDDAKQNKLKLKKVLDSCDERLKKDFAPKKVDKLLSEGRAYLGMPEYDKRRHRGFAFFVSPSLTKAFLLPVKVDEKLYYGKYFYLAGLAGNLSRYKSYYVLALSQKGCRLFKASVDSISEIKIRGVAKDIDEFLQYDVAEEHIQVHTAPSGKSAGTDAMFHGQGNVADDAVYKKNVEFYLKKVTAAVDKQLNGEKSAMVLAGVDFDKAVFRNNSSYGGVLEESVCMESGMIKEKQLHEDSWKIMEKYFGEEIKGELERYRSLSMGSGVSNNVGDVLGDAYSGRVDTLFFDVNESVFGRFNSEKLTVVYDESKSEDNEDLVNMAVVFSVKTDAKIIAVNKDDIGGPVAAILRY